MILCVFQSRRYDSRTTIFSPEGKFHFTDALQAVTYHSITLSMSELETVFLHKINELTLENNLCETNGLTICRTLVPSGICHGSYWSCWYLFGNSCQWWCAAGSWEEKYPQTSGWGVLLREDIQVEWVRHFALFSNFTLRKLMTIIIIFSFSSHGLHSFCTSECCEVYCVSLLHPICTWTLKVLA